MDINHIHNHHHTSTNSTKFPLFNWEKQQLSNSINMNMEDHHQQQQHHHHQQQHEQHEQQQHHQQQQHQQQNNHVHHPLIPLLDPVWQTYHNIPTPQQSPPSIIQPPNNTSSSSYIIKPSLNEQLLEEDEHELEEEEELGAMKEMMYRIAVMQPVDIDPATIRKPKRRNVRISNDPQSVAARHRREKISEKIRILQRLVPGGTKMDTASMLDEAIRYVKFLKRQIRQLQSGSSNNHQPPPPPQPPLPALPPSDWPPPPPPSASLVGGPTSSNTKLVLIRDNHHQHEGIMFQHGGN